MLNRIIRFSLQNRLLVLVAAVLLFAGGLYRAFHAEVDVFPDLNAPTVVVMTEAGGMAAEEVEQLVTFPIETAVNGATGVRRVRSSSTTGFSVVWVEFDWGTDIYLDRQIVSEKLATLGETLPENVGNPTLGPQSSILGELLIVGLTADSTSMLDLRTLADWTIRPRLLSTGGVAQVAVLGGDIKEYQVLLHPERMKHYGVTLADVMAVTRDMNRNTNGGVIYEYGNEYIVRVLLSVTGPVNGLFHTGINFMTLPEAFRPIYIISGIWQGAGWSSIMYTAALSNASQELKEAAMLDGANLIQQIRTVEWPAIKDMVVIQFILQAGNIMSIGFEKAYALQTDLNLDSAEIIATYVYKKGLLDGDYSFSTAVGLFNTVINVILLIAVNKVVAKMNDGQGL